MSDTDDAENVEGEVKKVTTVKKKKTPAKKKAPAVVAASDEADEEPPPSPPPKKAIKAKAKTPAKKAAPPPPLPLSITSEEATEPPPSPPSPKKTKKIPTSDEEEGEGVCEEVVVVVERIPQKKATPAKKVAAINPFTEKKAAVAVKTAAKKNASDDNGQIPPSDGTATITATAGNTPPHQQPLTADSQMKAALKRRGIVLKKPIHQGKHSVIYRGEMTTAPLTAATTIATPTTTDPSPTKRAVAVRIIFLDKIKRDAVRQRQKFLPRELSTLCSVHHEGLVTVHEVVRSGARVAVVMELLRDGTLTNYLTENGPFPNEAAAAPWFIEVTRALEYLHEECRLAHRNVKTDNILLNGGHVKLSLAAFPLDAWDWEENRPVLSKTMCGTHQYKCPQLVRNLPYDPYAADCWALGVVLFQLLNGKYPFSADNSEKEAMLAQQIDPAHLDRIFIRRNFSPELLRLLKEGLFVEDEKSRLTARKVLKHPWVKKFSGGLP